MTQSNQPADPNVRHDLGGWISGPSAAAPAPGTDAAAQALALAAVVEDLTEVLRRLAAGLPMGALEREHQARICDRLSEEIAAAAAALRQATR
ncbi:MAG TPA: hypothetical protein VKD66_15205 [Streptosporangiaceae bacterium]|nr:hypothetical protein [Streptosporangiaceae bacterium]